MVSKSVKTVYVTLTTQNCVNSWVCRTLLMSGFSQLPFVKLHSYFVGSKLSLLCLIRILLSSELPGNRWSLNCLPTETVSYLSLNLQHLPKSYYISGAQRIIKERKKKRREVKWQKRKRVKMFHLRCEEQICTKSSSIYWQLKKLKLTYINKSLISYFSLEYVVNIYFWGFFVCLFV